MWSWYRRKRERLTICINDAGPMLGQRRRRWANIKPAKGQRLMSQFAK